MERPGAPSHRHRDAVENLEVGGQYQLLGDRVLEQQEGPPKPAQPAIEGALGGQAGKQVTEVLVGIAEKAPLALPGNAAPPLRRQPQTEHLTVGQLRWSPA